MASNESTNSQSIGDIQPSTAGGVWPPPIVRSSENETASFNFSKTERLRIPDRVKKAHNIHMAYVSEFARSIVSVPKGGILTRRQ